MNKTEQSANAPSVTRRVTVGTDSLEMEVARVDAWLPARLDPAVAADVERMCSEIARTVAVGLVPEGGLPRDG